MPPPSTPYVELRCRSAFSFLGAGSLPEDLVARASELELPVLALGDRDGLYGAPRFWKAARAHGIRGIVAAEVSIEAAPGMPPDSPLSRVLLLVESGRGYRNLTRLLTLGHARGGKQRCESTWTELEAHAGGLSCLAGSGRGPLARAIARQDPDEARGLLDRLIGIFPRRLWVDLQRSRDERVERRLRVLRDLAAAAGVPIVATGDVVHARAPDRRVVDVLRALRRKTTLDALGRSARSNDEARLVSPHEMVERFRDLPRALRASVEIAERCEFTLDDLGYRFPDYPVPPGQSPNGYLRELTFGGALERYGRPIPTRVRAQLEHELAVIERIDLAGYFLIVWDIVRFCRERSILVQGRGSAANSAVCYSLGITAVDPVGMELLFERFLSEERGEWPDIDLDLPSGDRREEVIRYVYRRHGPASPGASGAAGQRLPAGDEPGGRTVGSGVAMTANVITYRTRSALREAGKVLGFSPLQIDRLSRLLAGQGYHDEQDSLATQLRRGGIDGEAPRVKLLLECVDALRGLPRHLGQHSGGMVIAAGRLDDVVPLEPATMPGRSVVQWDKEDCADLGLIKIDLLGLGMLAALEEAIPLVRQADGVALDLARLPADDPKTYAMIRKADTIGVFQIESRAQMATLPRLRPRKFYDLVVEVAIIRPGPIVGQMVHPYLNRRAGREPVTYPHPSLEPILRRTLGVPLFQEQLLRIAMTAAGFTGGEAEELRRAMGFKRSAERMRAIERRLRDGLAASGIGAEPAERIVASITSFALYGFPESHAASFALIAYASAYLRAHHPEAFTCALLNAWPMGFYHPATIVHDAQRHGVVMLPIDVTRSGWRCTIEPFPPSADGPRNGVRLGLRFVRGFREEAAERLCAARAQRVFVDLPDLAHRARLDRRELVTLAELGALARLMGDRPRRDENGRAWHGDERRRRSALWQVRGLARPEESLLAGLSAPPSQAPVAPMSSLEETLADYRTSGLTVGPQILHHLRAGLDRRGVARLGDLVRRPDGAWVRAAGLAIVRQRPGTAKGFCFVTLEDETGLGNLVLTRERYDANRTILHTTGLLLAEGRLQRKDGVVHLRVARLEALGLEEGPLPPGHDYH